MNTEKGKLLFTYSVLLTFVIFHTVLCVSSNIRMNKNAENSRFSDVPKQLFPVNLFSLVHRCLPMSAYSRYKIQRAKRDHNQHISQKNL